MSLLRNIVGRGHWGSTIVAPMTHNALRGGRILAILAAVLLLAGGMAFLVGRDHGLRRQLGQGLACLVSGKGEDRAKKRFSERLRAVDRNETSINPRLLVKKSARLLLVLDGEHVLATFPIGLGPNPVGPKKEAADGRSPEGEYYICYKKENSRYHLFLGLSYPSPDDAAEAMARGLLTATETEAVLDAWMKRERTPWNTALGGPYGIHGYGAGSDWTEGTIAMHNAHIEELFWNLPLGTPVEVVP